MKINNKKVIVSTLALAMGAALAGSISGSVAWYQYSTRATAQFSGTSAGTSRNLQITTTSGLAKDATGWGWDLDNTEILAASNALGHSSTGDLYPISAIVTDGEPASFKGPGVVRQYPTLPDAAATDYVQFDLYFQSLDETKERETNLDIYLETFTVNYSGSKKLDEALRISISDGDSHKNLVSKAEGTTTTHGQLDLNNDSVNDRTIFQADDSTGLHYDSTSQKWLDSTDAEPTDYIDYKTDSADGAANSYATKAWSSLKATFTDAYTLSGTPAPVCSTGTGVGHLKVTMWLEGWAEVDGKQVWDSSLVGESFSVQMRFQTLAEKR